MNVALRYIVSIFMGVITLFTTAFGMMLPTDNSYDYSFDNQVEWWTAEEAGYSMDENLSMMSKDSMEIIKNKYLDYTDDFAQGQIPADVVVFTDGVVVDLGKEVTALSIVDGELVGNTVSSITVKEGMYGYIHGDNDMLDAVNANNNTKALQALIDQTSANGGGTVYVCGGDYKFATTYMRSNVTLKIAGDSSLNGVTCDQKAILSSYPYKKQVSNYSTAFIFINDCENVVVEGPGMVEANGVTYGEEPSLKGSLTPEDELMDSFNIKDYVLKFRQYIHFHKESGGRGNTFRSARSNNVTLRNILTQDSSDWNMRLHTIDNLTLENVIIHNNVHVENADGVDFVGCNNVVVKDCFVSAADDGICLKTYATDKNDTGCVNYDIYNCEVTSLASCFKVGTPTANQVKNINVHDCNFFRAGIMGGYAGVSLESADGTKMEDINIYNINMDGILSPVMVWLGQRLEHGNDEVGYLKNVTITDIYAKDVDVPSCITGCADIEDVTKIHYVEDITLKNFYVKYRPGVTEDLALPGVLEPLLSTTASELYPEITRVLYLGMGNYEESLIYDMPAYGLYARYVDGLTVENFNVIPREGTKLPLDNVQNVFNRVYTQDISWS